MLAFRCFFIISLILSCFAEAHSQEIEKFTPDQEIFMSELRAFFHNASDARSKEIKEMLDKFEGEWRFGSFSTEQREKVYQTSNMMLREKMKPYPYFYFYLKSVYYFVKKENSKPELDAFHSSLPPLITTKKRRYLPAFLESVSNLFESNFLYNKKGNNWVFRNGNYSFNYDSVPYFTLKNVTLICFASRDSIHIFNTNGVFFPLSNLWQGTNGLVTWERAGFDKAGVFARLTQYSIKLQFSNYIADSVLYFNSKKFKQPLGGKLHDKVKANTNAGNATYPKFTSYNTRIQIINLFNNVDYDGGFSMEGNRFLGTGNNERDAQIIFKRKNEEFLVLRSKRFSIRKDRLASKQASVTIYFDTDSIYHPLLQARYLNDNKELTLIRNDEGVSLSPFFNTYHEIDMYFETMNWKLNDSIIRMEKIKGLNTESRATFESNNFYSEKRFDRIAGISDDHPLVIIRNFCRNNSSRQFFVYELAEHMKLSQDQIRLLLINLAANGYLNYDSTQDFIEIKDKLFQHVDAKNKKIDYDVIRFNSFVKGESNASLNINTFDLTIKGVPEVFLSDSQQVYIYPRGNRVVMKKDRNILFSGQIDAGYLHFYASNCIFDYASFLLNMPVIDSLTLDVPIYTPFGLGKIPVQSAIEDLTGTLWIDNPQNKSSLQSYPNYPYFISHEESYVYYDDQETGNGAYKKDTFYFQVYPFTFDSLKTFSTEAIAFDGKLISAGIFPVIEQPIKVQEDYSLGFHQLTPEEGYPVYGGKGTFYNDIQLSNKGLVGDGVLTYLAATTTSDAFIFYPDSANAVTETFIIDELIGITEYPSVLSYDAFLHWLPYSDSMLVENGKDNPFNMYNNEALLDGNLVLTPERLTGRGLVTIEQTEVESNQFVFSHHELDADTADLRLRTVDASELAMTTNEYKTHIDFFNRKGEFRTTGKESTVEFPVNMYRCYMDELDWYMDDERISLTNSQSVDTLLLNTLSMIELIDADLSGSEFMSLNPLQDSLKFFSLKATYDLHDYILYADEVKLIRVADAAIFPEDEKVTILENGKMEPLVDATIIADTTSKQHIIYDAEVNILSRNNLKAKGKYDYMDEAGEIYQLTFDPISIDKNNKTYGTATISEEANFSFNPFFEFKGEAIFHSQRKFLTFDGGFRINQDCDELQPGWVAFKGELDPNNIYLPIEKKLYDLQKVALSDALLLTLGQDIYPAFFIGKDRYSDTEIITADGFLHYDKISEEFRIGSMDLLKKKTIEGNYLSLSNRLCILYGEGKLDLGIDYGEVNLSTFGNVSHYMIPDSTQFNIVMGVDFHFSDEVLDIIVENLNKANLDASSISNKKYKKALADMLGKEEADRINSEIHLYGYVKKPPTALENTLFFSDVKLTWNQLTRSYISIGQIGIGSINDEQINKKVDGYIELSKKRGGDRLNIYLQINNKEWYFFHFSNHLMQSYSSNDNYNQLLRNIIEKHRTLKLKDSKYKYKYIISTRRKAIDFLRKMQAL